MKFNFVFLAALAYVAVAVPVGNVQDVVDIEANAPVEQVTPSGTTPTKSPPGDHTRVAPHRPSPQAPPRPPPDSVQRRELD